MITLEKNIIKSENLSCNVTSIQKIELKIVPVKKPASKTVLNSMASALSQSISNGDEPVQIILRITCDDQSVKDLIWNKEPFIRNNLDYHKAIKEARALQEQVQKSIS